MRRITSTGLRVLLCAFLLAAHLGCSVAAPQVARPPAPSPAPSQTDEIDRRTSEPYKGDLSIFEDPNRERNLQIDRVMDILGIKAGSGVADIGAGSGWFTVRAARRVGEGGLVYAVEINQDYLKYIEDRAAREKFTNIRTVLGKEDDPQLPAASLDAVLLLKTYHEVARPVSLLKHVRQSMRAGALLGVIDRNGKGDDHGIDADAVVKEAGRAGFKLVEQYDFVKPDGMDYFLVFRASD
jgi:predicted methyltransferase